MSSFLGGGGGGGGAIIINTTPITGGADKEILFNDGGVVNGVGGLLNNIGTAAPIIDNGMSILWSGRPAFPTAFYNSSTQTTWIAWQGCSIAGARAEYITTYDHVAQLWTPQIYVFADPLGNDDHGHPAIVRDADGYVHMFGGAHGTAMKHYYTSSPDDPSAWTAGTDIGSSTTYPQAFLVGSQLFLFVRGAGLGSFSTYQVYSSSAIASGVVTWNSVVTICDAGASIDRIELGEPAISGATVYLTFTQQDNLGVRTDIYLMLYNTATGGVSNIDGSHTVAAGSLPISAADIITYFKVKTSTQTDFDVPSACFDNAGNYHLVWSDTVAGKDTVLHSVWNGATWSANHTVYASSFGDVSFTPIALSNGGIRVLYNGTDLTSSSNPANPYNIYTQTRTSGGVWSSASMLLEAKMVLNSALTPYIFFIAKVFNGIADFEALFGEASGDNHINNNSLVNAGNLRGWGWGEAGFVPGARSGAIGGPFPAQSFFQADLLVGDSVFSDLDGFDEQIVANDGLCLSLSQFDTANNQASLKFYYSHTTTIGGHSAVPNGDWLGLIQFNGDDGAASRLSSYISGQADGTFSSGSAPGRIVFATTKSGSTSATEALRIDAKQNVQVASELTFGGATSSFPGLVASSATLVARLADNSADTVLRASSFDINDDVFLTRDAAGIFAQRNSTNPQQFNVYNTFTDASNYERGEVGWNDDPTGSGLSFTIGTNVAGTGNPNRPFRIITAGVERFRIDGAGVYVYNAASMNAAAIPFEGGHTPLLQTLDLNSRNGDMLGLASFNTANNQPTMYFAFSRGTSFGAQTAVSSGDWLGNIAFDGSDGAAFQNAAAFVIQVDAAPSSGHVPGRIVIYTSSPSASYQEAGRIDSKKNWVLNSAAIATNATDGFLYIPTCAGTPTGTPTTYTGRVPMVYDTTNHQFWIYDSGWKQPKTPAGAATVTWQ